MKFSLSVIYIVFILLFSITLKAEESADPEVDPGFAAQDPIYLDLVKTLTDTSAGVKAAKAQVPELKKKIDTSEVNSSEKKAAWKEYWKAIETVRNLEQQAHYYKIRVDRRRVVANIAAKKAKAEGKPWPDPKEYSDYLLNRRLSTASRSWNDRVPKLGDRIPSQGKAESVKGQGSGEKASSAPAGGH